MGHPTPVVGRLSSPAPRLWQPPGSFNAQEDGTRGGVGRARGGEMANMGGAEIFPANTGPFLAYIEEYGLAWGDDVVRLD